MFRLYKSPCPSPHPSPVTAPSEAQEPDSKEHLCCTHSVRLGTREFACDHQASLLLRMASIICWLSPCRITALLNLGLLVQTCGPRVMMNIDSGKVYNLPWIRGITDGEWLSRHGYDWSHHCDVGPMKNPFPWCPKKLPWLRHLLILRWSSNCWQDPGT